MNDNKSINAAPEYTSDAFSQVLHLLKLDVNIYGNAKMCGNWRMNERTRDATCFHMVTMGSSTLDVPGYFQGVLGFGDLVIFARELPHTMVSERPLTGEPQQLDFREAQAIEGTGLLCGEVRFQHKGSRYLLDALPPVFVIRYNQATAWLRSLLEMVSAENMNVGAGSKVVFDRLSELLFTYALREHFMVNPSQAGMLAVYGHHRLAKVVEALHRFPDKGWTLEAMAKEASLSRTAFANAFKAVSGWTAGQYLAWWRMQLAWSLLSSGEKITQVAAKVGYTSESAFSRAFQKMFSVAAGKVRRGE